MTTTVTVTDYDSPPAMSDILAHRPVFKNSFTSSPKIYSTSANLYRHSYKTIPYSPSLRPGRAPLIVREARDEDAASIAAIRYAAYFPQPGHAQAYGRVPFADHVYFDGFNTQQFIANSTSLHARILVVEDTATKEIISTAKWFLPVRDGETAIDPSSLTKLNPSCGYLNLALLTTYNDSVETVEQVTWKGKRCYRLDTVTTSPHAQRRGAASLLLKWGIDRATRDGLPIYLCAEPQGHALYKRFGFVDIEGQTIRIPLKEYGGEGDWVIVPMMKEP